MSRVVLGRWGQSLAVRLPSDIAARLALTEGAALEGEPRDDEIVMRKVAGPPTIASIAAGKADEEWRVIDRDHGVDWGPTSAARSWTNDAPRPRGRPVHEPNPTFTDERRDPVGLPHTGRILVGGSDASTSWHELPARRVIASLSKQQLGSATGSPC